MLKHVSKPRYKPATGSITNTKSFYVGWGEYFEVSDVKQLTNEYNDPLTVMGWFKCAVSSDSSAVYRVITDVFSSTRGKSIDLIAIGGDPVDLKFALYNSSSVGISVSKPSGISNNNWFHVAFTYSGNGLASGVSMYVNGSALSSLSVSNDNLNGSTIRNTASKTRFMYSYSIDEGGFWGNNIVYITKALSASEITEAYNSGSSDFNYRDASFADYVKLWYRFDNDSAYSGNTTVNDEFTQSGLRGHQGVAVNTPTLSTDVP